MEPLGRGYRLHVRARNPVDGLSTEAVMSCTVLPPWYRTRWAYGVYLLGIVGVVGLGHRWRVRRLRDQRRVLRRQVAERTEELAEANRELREAYSSLEELSLTDQLTGLRNRRFLAESLEAEAARVAARRSGGGEQRKSAAEASLVFFLIDLDHFKEVNDTLGHPVGDRVLVQFAELLRRVFRESDHLVRWGGEEFLAVARTGGRSETAELAERVRATVQAHPFDSGEGRTLQKTCSIGFADFPFFEREPGALGWQQVVAVADRCLYAAKRSGRNEWVGTHAAVDGPREAGFPARWNEDPGGRARDGEVVIVSSIEGDALRWD